MNKMNHLLLVGLAIGLVLAGCSGDEPTKPTANDYVDQPTEIFNPNALTEWTAAGNLKGGSALSAASHPITVAGVGANFGIAAASQIFSSGDLAGTFVTIDATAFNAMSVAQLRASFDVLIFTWISTSAINADWNTRLLPYMALGGGIIFEDPGNLADLAPGVTAFNFDTGGAGITVSATVPGLTDGIVNSFVNNHIGFSAWDPALSPFLDLSGTVVGLFGHFGSGCIVLTGPDQHFHGFRGAGNPAGNQ